MAVGALEPQFYSLLLKGLELSEKEFPQFPDDMEKHKKIFASIFKLKTQDDWCKVSVIF